MTIPKEEEGGHAMTQSYTPRQIADGLLAGEFTRNSAFVPLAEVEELKRQNKHLVRHNEWYLETLTEASLGRTEILAVIGTSLCVRFPKTFIDASMTEEDRRIIEKVMRQTSHADSDRERTEASREAERTLWFSRICAMRRAGIMVEETKP